MTCGSIAKLSMSLVVNIVPLAPQAVPPSTITHTVEYADEANGVYLCESDVSRVSGNIFQGVITKRHGEKTSLVKFSIWELSPEGRKLREMPIHQDRMILRGPVPELFPCLRVLPDGDILAIVSYGHVLPSVVRVDVQGNILFSKPLSQRKRDSAHYLDIVPALENQALVVGQVRGRPTILKLDRNGDILFEKQLDIQGGGVCSSGARLSDGSFYICGLSYDWKQPTSWLIQVDDQGDVQREFIHDNVGAGVACMRVNHRVMKTGLNRIAFVHPVSTQGKLYCHLRIFDQSLEQIKEIMVCEVPDFGGAFRLQPYSNGIAVATKDNQGGIWLHLFDDHFELKGKKGQQDYLTDHFYYTLAISDGRALLLGNQGLGYVARKNKIRGVVFNLTDERVPEATDRNSSESYKP